MSTLGWLSSVASSTFIVTTQIEAMINVTNPDYAFERWQYTLIMIAFTVITIFFNTWGAPVLPSLETFCLFGHVIGFFVIMIPLVVLCPKNSASDVFLDFQDNSGYNNMGAAYLISQVYVMYCNLGSDSVSIAKHTSTAIVDPADTMVEGRPHKRGSRERLSHCSESNDLVLLWQRVARYWYAGHHALLHRATRGYCRFMYT